MNRLKAILFFTVVLVFARMPVHAAESTTQIQTKHYRIISDNGNADQTGRQMEALFEVYNRVFMFDPVQASLPLNVRIFSDTDAYNNYIRSALAAVSPGALYLHFEQSGKRELLLDLSNNDAKHSIPYQAFIQYLRAFVSQPPLWMLKGFAAFFSTLSFSEEGKLMYEENLGWLNIVKKMKERPAIEDILLTENGGQEFQNLACSLVSFFLHSGKEEYTRSFTDSLMTLSGANNAAQNAAAVTKRILLGHGTAELAKDYERYLDSRKTFAELVAEGQKAYSSGDRAIAELSFRAALELKSSHFVPYYYLGLLAYDAEKFDMAQQFFLAGIDNGADPALVFYAMGVNAAVAGKREEAAGYLRKSGEADPGKYQEKTQKIISLFSR